MAARADTDRTALNLDGPRALRPREHSAAIKLLHTVFRPQGPHTILKEYPLALGKKNANNIRVIAKDKEILSHVAIYYSNLRSGDLVFKVGGVGSVATHPSYQGQGLASAVMKDCIRVMEENGRHLSILWTQRHSFYQSLGYERAGASYLYRARVETFDKIPSECDVIPYSPRRLPDIIALHERESLRTERTAKEYEAYFGLPKTNALLAIRNQKVSAYAVMGKGEDLRYCIHDWGGNARDLLYLARLLAASAGSGEFMILAPAQPNEFTNMLDRMGIQKMFDYLAMMRVVDIEGFSSVVSDYLTPRIGCEFRIRRTQSGLRLGVGDEEAPLEEERKLTRIVFGPDSPSSLLRGFSPGVVSALDSALPIPLFIWGLDSV